MCRPSARIAAALLVISLLSGCIKEVVYVDGNGNVVGDPNRSPDIAITNLSNSANDALTYVGNWSAPLNTLDHSLGGGDGGAVRSVRISTSNDEGSEHSTQTCWFSVGHVDGLPLRATQQGAPVQFSMQREAGSLEFTGTVKGTVAGGEVRLALDRNYSAQMQKLTTGTAIDPPHAMQLLAWDLTVDYARGFHDAEYSFSLDDLFELRRMAVEPAWAAELKQAGYNFRANELTELRRMGVESKYAKALREGGLDLSAEQLTALRRTGVESSYAVKVNASGVAKDVDSIIQLRRMGVQADYITAIRSAGYNFNADQMVSIRRMGVEAAWARKLKQAGYDFDADGLVTLRRVGVAAEYATALVVPGRKNLSADDIASLRRRGIDAETAAKLRQ